MNLRYALRRLARDRGFTAAAVVALGLGIGGASAVFTLMNGIFFKGLPSSRPEQIVAVGIDDRQSTNQRTSLAEFEDLAASSGSFTQLTATLIRGMVIADEGRSSERILGTFVSGSTFSMLDESAILGRTLIESDDRPGAPAVVLLGYSTWQNRYGADRTVIGRPVTVNGIPATVVGVMREGFRFPTAATMWMPLSASPEPRDARGARMLGLIGRLRDGVSIEQAQAELTTRIRALTRRVPDGDMTTAVRVQPFATQYIGTPIQLILTALLGAVGLLVLIGCANVANLLLARAATRRREVSIRMAIGASRGAIVAQLLTESTLLAVGGGLLGLTLSMAGMRVFEWFTRRPDRPYWFDFSVDSRVLLFLTAISFLTVILFGLVPALRTARADVTDSLRDRDTADPGPRRWADALVVVELALTLTLLAGAALMTRAVLTLLESGFDPEPLAVMRLDAPPRRYSTPESRADLVQTIEERLAATSLISAAAASSSLPSYGAVRHELTLDGQAAAPGSQPVLADAIKVGARYFETMGLPVTRGRMFGAREGNVGTRVVVVNDAFVARHFSDIDPLGHQIRLRQRETGADTGWVTIVGIVPTVRQRTTGDPGPLVYVPYRTIPEQDTGIIMRVRGDGDTALSVARETVRGIDPEITLYSVMSMERSLSDVNFIAPLFGSMFIVFATIALVLCTTGLYAVTAYTVSRRTREIGVRVALGAQKRDVAWLVMRRGLFQLAPGLLIGLIGAAAMGRVLSAATGSAGARDPLTVVAAVVLLTTVMLTACLIPARRAARLDPMVALRTE